MMSSHKSTSGRASHLGPRGQRRGGGVRTLYWEDREEGGEIWIHLYVNEPGAAEWAKHHHSIMGTNWEVTERRGDFAYASFPEEPNWQNQIRREGYRTVRFKYISDPPRSWIGSTRRRDPRRSRRSPERKVSWKLPKDIPYSTFTSEFQAKGIGFSWAGDHFIFFGPRVSHAKALANAAVKRIRKAGLGLNRTSRSPISRSVAKKMFYSGTLVLEVRLLEGHHVEPRKRERQVRGCKHNYVYRIQIWPSGQGDATIATQWVCPPAHLSRGVESLGAMRSAAHAALSFADHEGWPIGEYAATTDSGWHVGATKLHAWPRERKGRR